MKWINTQELVSMLKRFPSKQIDSLAYLGNNITSAHRWEYSTELNVFILTIGNVAKSYSEAEMFRLYCNRYWNVIPFFFLRNDLEKQLANRLVEELIVLGRLEDIIIDNGIDNLRVCEHCHHLMNEGWLVDDIRTFCSNDCLLSIFPNVNIPGLQSNATDDNSSAYWTAWEG